MTNPFNYHKAQIIALIVVLVAIAAVIAIDWRITKGKHENITNADSICLSKEFAEFRKGIDTVRNDYADKFYDYGSYDKQQYGYHNHETHLFKFDPNTLDSAGFRSLGLPGFIAQRIVKYREKGGVFRKPEDLSRIYGLREQDFKRLAPYIHISSEYQDKQQKIQESPKRKTYTSVNVNSADTTALTAIAGLYPNEAKAVINHRKRLGGYVSSEQIKEALKWMDNDNRRNEIMSRLNIDPNSITKININRSSVNRMASHPYINFYQARAIYEYRHNNGKIKSIDELTNIKEPSITEEFIQRIKPYLTIE